MLEFKKYLNEINENLANALYTSVLKRGACGNKSCSRRQPGEYSWRDEESNQNTEDYKIININPPISNNSKLYYNKNKEYITIEFSLKDNNPIKINYHQINTYNNYIQKNKNEILTQIGKQDQIVKYFNYAQYENKLLINFKIEN